jgi:hypothetical protein
VGWVSFCWVEVERGRWKMEEKRGD